MDSDSKHGFANYSTENHLVVECGFKPTSVMVVSTDNYRRHIAYINADKNLNYYAADNAGASLASDSHVYINTTANGFVAIFGGTRAVLDGQEFEWFACK